MAYQVSPEVQQWFAAVDRDRSGRISANELKAALANGQGRCFSDTACRLMIGSRVSFCTPHIGNRMVKTTLHNAGQLLVQGSTSDDTPMETNIWRALSTKVSTILFPMCGMFDKEKRGNIDVQEFQALYNYVNSWLGVFRGFDHDNSGSIQESELSAALTQMGYRFSPAFIQFLIKKSDFNQHESISVDQFIVVCVQIQRFTEAFRQRDTAQTGTISIEFEDFLSVALNCSV